MVDFDLLTSLDDDRIVWYENLLVPEAVWDGDLDVGVIGNGVDWADPNNWSVDLIHDQLPTSASPGRNVLFGTGPTVSSIDIGADRRVNTLTFQENYDLRNHAITITSGQVNVESGVTATIQSDLASEIPAGIVKRGSGTLVIAGTAPDVVLDRATLELTAEATIDSLTINRGRAIVAGRVQGDIFNLGGTLVNQASGVANSGVRLNPDNIDKIFSEFFVDIVDGPLIEDNHEIAMSRLGRTPKRT